MKTAGLCRLQLTLKGKKPKALKESGKSLREMSKFAEFIKAIADGYLAQFINPILDKSPVPVNASENALVVDWQNLLQRVVSANAAMSLAEQWVRTGQLSFKGILGPYRTKLKKIGAIHEVGKGTYKFRSKAEIEVISLTIWNQNLLLNSPTASSTAARFRDQLEVSLRLKATLHG